MCCLIALCILGALAVLALAAAMSNRRVNGETSEVIDDWYREKAKG